MEVVTYKRLKSQSTKNNINNMDDTICCTIINLDDIPSCCFTPTKMTIKLRFLETNQQLSENAVQVHVKNSLIG